MIESTDLSGRMSDSDELLGNKAKNLKRISTLDGISVPRGVALLPSFSREFLSPLRPEIQNIIASAEADDASQRIENLVVSHSSEALDAWWESIRSGFDPDQLFAIRSSGHPIVEGLVLAEDSGLRSLAGQYSSFLDRNASEVVDAIKKCIASLFNARSLDLFNVQHDLGYLGSEMTVLVQEMIDAKTSGVMMTRDPIEGDDDLLGVEGGPGPCSQYVDGSAQGDFFLVSKQSGKIVSFERGDSTTDGSANGLSEPQVVHLCNAGVRLERQFGAAQDVEFAHHADGRLIILQTRPITTN